MGNNFLAGFDDWMEQREPGYKAKCAREADAREQGRLVRRAEIIARYGSEEAALAPCPREAALRKALAPWIKWCEPPHDRWTYSIDDEGGFLMGLPDHIAAAVASALPLPQTVAEAKAESDYWRARGQEMLDVIGDGPDYGLDRPAVCRMDMVEDMLRRELPVRSAEDFRARLTFAARLEDPEIVRLHEDFERLVKREALPRSSRSLPKEGRR